MANKFILYREHPQGGDVSDGNLRDNAGVTGIYDSAAEVPVFLVLQNIMLLNMIGILLLIQYTI